MTRTERSATPRLPRALLAVLALALASCSDIGLPVLGWDAGTGCAANVDCVGVAGRPVCETVSRRCVQCTPAMDVCAVGQYCDAGAFTCMPGCRNDTDCAGTPATPRCNVAAHRCVECVADTHCPTGQRCMNFMCAQCTTNADCPSGEVCVNRMCRRGCDPAAPRCMANEMCCPEMGANLCIDTQSNPSHCGACGTQCRLANATAACAAGRCTVGMCNAGSGNCDMSDDNGCETELQTSPTHCGACGNACPMGQVCTAGMCACPAGQTLCAGRCVSTQTDNAHCGACNNACPAGQSCMAGACVCPMGLTFCAMRCVDTQTDLMHCGMCGRACSGVNGTPSCVGGACGIACNTGFGNCNMDASDGCEVNLNTSDLHCGACGNACPMGAACVNGLCHRFPSNGTEGPYNPAGPGVVMIPGGVHNFTTITVPAGVTVRSTGPEPLDLRATGPVLINGIVDVSGGNGGTIACGANRNGSSGGSAGLGMPGANNATCVSGLPACGGQGGLGGGATGVVTLAGAAGTLPTRGAGGDRGGGGGGGYDPAGGGGGGGGGGQAGGGGGAGAGRGCASATGESGVGGRGGGTGGGVGGTTMGAEGAGRGGTTANPMYAGRDGSPGLSCGTAGSILGGGGGGGSIGDMAANDLSVDNGTFYAGSSGGGGGGPLGAGGGGGGGALRIASHVSINIGATGQVLSQGGDGVRITCSTGGGGGGGGSGGVIYVYAPTVTVAAGAVVSADPGDGGFATGGGGQGGPGGLGRIRVSVQTGRCSLAFASFNPALADSMCSFAMGAGTPGTTFIRRYPD